MHRESVGDAENGANPGISPPAPRQRELEPSAEIVPANLRSLEPIYYAAMLEEARVFEVVDRLVAMFSQGLLPISHGRAGAILYRYWKSGCERLTAAERATVYARVFGLSCGAPGVVPNSQFNELWLRFISVVGMYSSELQVLPPGQRTVTPADVLSSGRDLALNLSSHGLGLAWYAAQDFKPENQRIGELLSDPEVQAAFAARDPWQVVQNVALSELGARPNVQRGRTRAESGVIVLRWLANRRARLLRPKTASILSHEDICEGRTAASQNKKVNVYPTDCDLVAACEQWLGVSGTQEAELKEGEPLPLPVRIAPGMTPADPAASAPPADELDSQAA